MGYGRKAKYESPEVRTAIRSARTAHKRKAEATLAEHLRVDKKRYRASTARQQGQQNRKVAKQKQTHRATSKRIQNLGPERSKNRKRSIATVPNLRKYGGTGDIPRYHAGAGGTVGPRYKAPKRKII